MSDMSPKIDVPGMAPSPPTNGDTPARGSSTDTAGFELDDLDHVGIEVFGTVFEDIFETGVH